MLDQRPAPWRPGDSIAVAQLTPVSRCERMRARRDRLAEAAGREYAPVRFILVEVEDLGPYGGLGITVRYRGDAEGEFRCSVTGYPDGPPYACSSADTGGDSTGRTREESRALQVRVLATWMDANPEVTVCLAGLAKSSSRDTPTAPDLELRRPARSDLHAIGRLLSDRYPTRVAPYCVPARDGHPTSALDELHLRAERRRECEALRSSVAAAESRGASPRETDRILGAGAMSNCYPSPAELVDPYGRPAARLAISAPAFQTHGPARVMMSPSFHTSRREYQLCSFERLEDGWAATPECESSVYSH